MPAPHDHEEAAPTRIGPTLPSPVDDPVGRGDDEAPGPGVDQEAGEGPAAIVSAVLNTLFWVAIVTIVGAVAGSVLGFYRLDVVMSGSMRPVYAPGDLVIAQTTPANQLATGDVIQFRTPPEYGSERVTHRVTGIEMSPAGVVSVRTKGDNNDTADPWTAEVPSGDVWVVTGAIPKVGYLAHWSKTWWPLLIALALALPMLSAARQHTRRTDDDESRVTSAAGVTPRRNALSLLWFLPAAVVIASGAWASVGSTLLPSSITQDVQAWDPTQADHPTLLAARERTDLELVPTMTGFGLRHLTVGANPLTRGAVVEQAITIPSSRLATGRTLTMTAAAAQPNELSAGLHVEILACATAWTLVNDAHECTKTPSVLVGDAPIEGTTISLLDADDRAGKTGPHDLHLLLVFRAPRDAGVPDVGLRASLDLRFDAS